MKKFYLNFFQMMLTLFTIGTYSFSFGQLGTIQIGSGTTTINGATAIPVSNYNYNYSQQLVTAAEYSAGGGAAGPITKLRYYCTGLGTTSVWNDWTVYIGNTTRTSFTSTTDWVPLAELTQVFSGTIVPVANNWFEITFSTPFNYTGGNLVVAVDENTPGWLSPPTFRSYTSTANSGLQFRDDSVNPDPASPPTTPATSFNLLANLPQLQFEGTLSACPPPSGITLVSALANELNISWTGSASSWEIEWGAPGFIPGTGAEIGSDVSIANTYQITGLTASTVYHVYVKADCDSDGVSSWSAVLQGTTACDIYTAPFLESFSGTLPLCWSNTSSNPVANGLWKFSGTVDYASGNTRPNGTFAWADGSDPSNISDITLTTPWVDVSGLTTPALFFEFFSNNTGTYANNVLSVQVRDQSSAWTTIFTNNTSSNQWGDFEYILSSLGSVVQARFIFDKSIATSGYAFYNDILVDEVRFDEATSCPKPTAFTLGAVGSDSLTVSWTPGATETQWNIVWGEPGFSPGDADQIGTVTVTTNPYTINGLIENTEYDVYVQANCGVDSSLWVGPIEVLTSCAAIPAIGFCEDFEDIEALSCWRVINANADADVWAIYTGYANSGTQSAGLYTDYNAGNNDDYIVLPRMTLTGNEVLTFHYRARSSGEPNDFRVVLSTTGAEPTDFTNVILPLMTVSNTVYKDTSINLSAYSGDVYIAFHVPPGGLDGYYLYIDDVCVDICNPVAGIDGAIDLCRTAGTVDLNTVITSQYTHGTWSLPANQGVINGANMNISTLANGTYDALYIVTTACTSDTTVASITVGNPSSAGTNGVMTVCKSQFIDLYGGLNGNVDFGGTWYTPDNIAMTNSYFQTGTLPGQFVYKYIVSNGICGPDTAEVTVNILNCVGLEDVSLLDNVTIAPNPNTGNFQIIGVAGADYTFEVLDINGRIIRESIKITSTTTDVNLTDVENGVYMVRIFGNNNERMMRVIKH